MSSRAMLIFAAISGFFYVALGVFGTHILKPVAGERRNGLDENRAGLPSVPYSCGTGFGCSDATPRRYMVLLEQRVSGAGHGFIQRQPLLSGAVAPENLGVCYASRRHLLLIGWILMLVGALRLKKGRSL